MMVFSEDLIVKLAVWAAHRPGVRTVSDAAPARGPRGLPNYIKWYYVILVGRGSESPQPGSYPS